MYHNEKSLTEWCNLYLTENVDLNVLPWFLRPRYGLKWWLRWLHRFFTHCTTCTVSEESFDVAINCRPPYGTATSLLSSYDPWMTLVVMCNTCCWSDVWVTARMAFDTKTSSIRKFVSQPEVCFQSSRWLPGPTILDEVTDLRQCDISGRSSLQLEWCDEVVQLDFQYTVICHRLTRFVFLTRHLRPHVQRMESAATFVTQFLMVFDWYVTGTIPSSGISLLSYVDKVPSGGCKGYSEKCFR